MSKEKLGELLRRLRVEKKLPLRKVAALLDVDVAILRISVVLTTSFRSVDHPLSFKWI